jgi:methyltransferase
MLIALLLFAAFGPMAFEARLAARHERALRAGGAVEPRGDVYRLMQFAYPACFLSMTVEARVRDSHVGAVFGAGLVIFLSAKLLKYWAMATLGPRWSFRILVPPDSTRITAGPYRFLAHPNYAAVAGELAGFGLMARAPIAAAGSIAVFGLLVLTRIRVEERALEGASGVRKYAE